MNYDMISSGQNKKGWIGCHPDPALRQRAQRTPQCQNCARLLLSLAQRLFYYSTLYYNPNCATYDFCRNKQRGGSESSDPPRHPLTTNPQFVSSPKGELLDIYARSIVAYNRTNEHRANDRKRRPLRGNSQPAPIANVGDAACGRGKIRLCTGDVGYGCGRLRTAGRE